MKKIRVIALLVAIVLMFAGFASANSKDFRSVDAPDEFFLGLSLGESREAVLAKFPQAYESENPEPGTEGALFVEEINDDGLRHVYTIGFDDDDKVYTVVDYYAFKNTGEKYSLSELNRNIGSVFNEFKSKLTSLYGKGTALGDTGKAYEWQKDGVAYVLRYSVLNDIERYGCILLYNVKTE